MALLTPKEIADAKAARLALQKQNAEYAKNVGKTFLDTGDDNAEVKVTAFDESHLCRGETQHKPSYIVNHGNENVSRFIPCETFLKTHNVKE